MAWENRCHGNGNPPDGCCYIQGSPCPLRAENLDGRRWACSVASRISSENPDISDEEYRQRWTNDPEYQTMVAPKWREVEQRIGLPVGAMDCPTWRGTAAPECCYAESPEENEANCIAAGVV